MYIGLLFLSVVSFYGLINGYCCTKANGEMRYCNKKKNLGYNLVRYRVHKGLSSPINQYIFVLLSAQYIITAVNTRDVTSRGSNSNSTRSSNLYYCSIKARSSKFIFEPKLELARTRNKSSRVQPKYRCQSRTN